MLTRTCSICVPSSSPLFIFFCPDTAPTELYTLSLHDALPISRREGARGLEPAPAGRRRDHVDRRTEARQPVARDADPAVVRDGRNGIDRDPAQAEAHDPDLEGSCARRPLLPHAPRARRARGSERAAAPPVQAAGAPAARLRNARR